MLTTCPVNPSDAPRETCCGVSEGALELEDGITALDSPISPVKSMSVRSSLVALRSLHRLIGSPAGAAVSAARPLGALPSMRVPG